MVPTVVFERSQIRAAKDWFRQVAIFTVFLTSSFELRHEAFP